MTQVPFHDFSVGFGDLFSLLCLKLSSGTLNHWCESRRQGEESLNVHVNISALPKSCVTDMWRFGERVCHHYWSREEIASSLWNPMLVASLTAAASERNILVTWKRVTKGAVYRDHIFRDPTWKTCVLIFSPTQRIPKINTLRADPQILVGFPFHKSFPRRIQLGHI